MLPSRHAFGLICTVATKAFAIRGRIAGSPLTPPPYLSVDTKRHAQGRHQGSSCMRSSPLTKYCALVPRVCAYTCAKRACLRARARGPQARQCADDGRGRTLAWRKRRLTGARPCRHTHNSRKHDPGHHRINTGWRIPFWSGLLIGIFAVWLRRDVSEPPPASVSSCAANALSETAAMSESARDDMSANPSGLLDLDGQRDGQGEPPDPLGPTRVAATAAAAAAPKLPVRVKQIR